MDQRPSSRPSAFWFLLGAATGIVIGYSLNSDRGRRLRREAGEQAIEYGQTLGRSASGQARRVRAQAVDIGKAIRQRLDRLGRKQ